MPSVLPSSMKTTAVLALSTSSTLMQPRRCGSIQRRFLKQKVRAVHGVYSDREAGIALSYICYRLTRHLVTDIILSN